MPEPGPRLLFADGGVSGLLACAATPNADNVVVAWRASPVDPSNTRRAAVMRQAEVFGLRYESLPDLQPPSANQTHIPVGTTTALYQAAQLAVSLACPTLVWPISAGPGRNDGSPDPLRIAAAFERAELVMRLIRLDLPAGSGFSIDTPYADLTDRQLADLVLDMDLPIWLCWWAGSQDAEAVAEQGHWTRLLNAAGWSGELPHAALQPEVVIPSHRTAAKPR